MKLFEHPDFEQAILRATEHFQNRRLRAAIIEKDYYVTEALRLIATTAPDKIIWRPAYRDLASALSEGLRDVASLEYAHQNPETTNITKASIKM
jgi:hypothetical protein